MINSWIFVVLSCFPPFPHNFRKSCTNFVSQGSKVQCFVWIIGIFSSYSCEILPISATQLVYKTGSFRLCYVNAVCWVDIFLNGITPFSHRPITLKHTPNRLPQYLHIQPQTPLTDILRIQLHHFFEVRYIASAADLPHSCEAGAEGHSCSVVRFI